LTITCFTAVDGAFVLLFQDVEYFFSLRKLSELIIYTFSLTRYNGRQGYMRKYRYNPSGSDKHASFQEAV
jgi:hypothetical protein